VLVNSVSKLMRHCGEISTLVEALERGELRHCGEEVTSIERGNVVVKSHPSEILASSMPGSQRNSVHNICLARYNRTTTSQMLLFLNLEEEREKKIR
jgi:hypothetical protein